MFGIKTLNKKLCTLNKNMFEADRRTKTKETKEKSFIHSETYLELSTICKALDDLLFNVGW